MHHLPESVRSVLENLFKIDLSEYNGGDWWGLPLPGPYAVYQSARAAYVYANSDCTKHAESSALVDALRGL